MAANAIFDGCRAGGLPEPELGSFNLGIAGYINWTYNAL